MLYEEGGPWHSGSKWRKPAENKLTPGDFTSFSIYVSAILHNFRFRFPALHIQNLSNRCRHEYDSSISRIFKNLIFGRLLQFGPTVLGRVVGSVGTFVRTLEKKITGNSFLWGFHICLWWRWWWGRAACFLVISFHFFIP